MHWHRDGQLVVAVSARAVRALTRVTGGGRLVVWPRRWLSVSSRPDKEAARSVFLAKGRW